MESGVTLEQVCELCKLCAGIMLANGAETYRAEETVNKLGEHYGLDEVEVLAIPTGVFLTLRAGTEQRNALRRITRRTIDLEKVDQANTISRALVEGRMELSDATAQLKRMECAAAPGGWQVPVLVGLSGGFFALMFGGGWMDFLLGVVAAGVTQVLARVFAKEPFSTFVTSLAGSALIAVIAQGGCRLTGQGTPGTIIIGAIMPLLPGLAMTNAIRDTMRGDLVSGVARAAEALLVAVALAVGVGVVLVADRLVWGGGL
ncbi:MAG: threonine/serine exporter family protein [Eubacteriales bacterium]|nr:threonine/serine exporter family protein [Eubacteriales bacterium]